MMKRLMKHHARDEVLEAIAFLISDLFFLVGCILFLPSIPSSYAVSAAGAWCCIIGSFGLVLGVFYTATCFEADHGGAKLDETTADRCRKLTKLNMLLTHSGTVL